MNIYVELINKTIDYIEDNIHESLSLEDIAKRVCVSKFHFNRMFKTVSGMTLKQYILGRKLTEALKELSEREMSVIDAAYHFGFEYPEVFSRAFKKQFSISPSEVKNKKPEVTLVKKIKNVERDITNYKGTLTLNGTPVYLDELKLKGIFLETDVNDTGFKEQMTDAGENYLEAAKKAEELEHERLYAAVSCHGEDDGTYTVFYGMKEAFAGKETTFKEHIIPSGWYIKFIYCGNMFDIREVFVDDLYRWMMVREIELNPNGIGMLNIFEKDYEETNEVQILVPIKKPL